MTRLEVDAPARHPVDTAVGTMPLRTRRHRLGPDIAIATGYLLLAVGVLARQWRAPNANYLTASSQDQSMWEWFFAVAAHSLVQLQNPLGTDLQNHPLGVNMMANTAMFGVSIPLAPITLLFGPAVTYLLVLTVGLFGTAAAWYWLFSRYVVRSRSAAAIAGGFCGFAPAMVSHANAHPNFVALFLLPLVLAQLIRIVRGEARPVRGGVLLGLLVSAQILLGEEPLLIFTIAVALFGLVYFLPAATDLGAAVRRLFGPIGVAVAVTVVLLGIPLWWQFFGPQSYRFIDHGEAGNDAKSLVQFPSASLGGWWAPGQNVAIRRTEQNAYFGWPLLMLLALVAFWLRDNRIARAAAVTIVVFGMLSLGSELTIGLQPSGIPLPWHWLADLPLLESVLETRFAMACVPAIAVLLALATDRAVHDRAITTVWFTGLFVALVPLIPAPLPVADRGDTPTFFADGSYRQFLSGGSVVVVPLPRSEDARALRWQTDAGFDFPIAGGYFVGPVGTDGEGSYGPNDRPTTPLLRKVADTGSVPPVDDAARRQFTADLQYWQADVLVLPINDAHSSALRETLTQLLGRDGTAVDDVRVWDVRALTHADSAAAR